MPRNGRPLLRTLSCKASIMPGTAARPCLQSANAPTPGNTIRSAATTSPGSALTVTRAAVPLSRAARSNALAAECRLPEPESTMTTRCMALRGLVRLVAGSDQPANHGPVTPTAAAGCRSRPRRDDRLRGDPGRKEAAFAFAAIATVAGAQHAPAAPLQRPAPQRVALEGDHEIEGHQAEGGPTRVDDRRHACAFDGSVGDDIGQQRPPQAVHQQPQRAEQQRTPGEPLLDEDQAFRPIDA